MDVYAPAVELNNRFVPVLRLITGAGWQPITRARSSNSAVWLERWGPAGDGALYLTAYNPDKRPHDTTIVVDADMLGLKGANVSVADMLSNGAWPAPLNRGRASISLTMPPEQTRVLRFR
jgi:hypothetical protein